MKIFKRIPMMLMAGIAAISFSACENEGTITPEPQEPEYITVNLGLAGEYVELSETPLETRAVADTSDLIAIQVYTMTGEPNTTGYGSVLYASGVFNSMDNVTVRLLAGQRYRFEASIQVDAFDCPMHNFECGCNYQPNWYWWKSSEFRYGTYSELTNVSTFWGDDCKFERYYGRLEEYTPTTGGSVQIMTKRVSYGAHFIAEGLTDGTLEVKVGGDYTELLTPAYPEVDRIYSFNNAYSAWIGNYDMATGMYQDYSQSITLDITWVKNDGSRNPLGLYDVTFKRNVRTTVKIKVEDNTNPSGISVIRMDEPMYNDSKEYLISGGQVVEVPVYI